MFKSYGEKLQEIEKYYEGKDYEYVVVECAKLTEQAVGYLFRNFHRTLENPDKRSRFLEFEKSNGEKYSSFIKKPTIGVGIGFYNSLLGHCADHQWLKPELKSALNTINTVRNAQVHAGKAVVTDHEAGEVIDATESFLKGIELYDLPVEDVGFPLKYYLVYTSIKSKFEKGETETEFKRIINDAAKLIPDLLNSVFNKVYPFLPIEDKEKLNTLHPKTLTAESKEISLKYFIEIFDEINLFNQIEDGEDLKKSLQAIAEEMKEVFSRRATRHHVNVLDFIFQFIHNKKLDHFLDFADLVKKKYLEDNQINETDRIILNDRAKELNISGNVAETIEGTVVRTIEKELILFQTLHEEKALEETELAREKAEKMPVKFGLKLNKRLMILLGVIFVVVLFTVIYLLLSKSELANYECAYLEGNYDEVIKKSDRKRTLSNISANYYYITSVAYQNPYNIPKKIKREYQELLKDNPESPEAHLYLGSVYHWSDYNKRHEIDSSLILVERAIEMGLENEYAELIKAELIEHFGQPSMTLKMAQELVGKYPDNIMILEFAADVFAYIALDTTRSIELFEKVKEIYPDYLYYYIRRSRFAINRGDFAEAGNLLSVAEKINDKNRGLADSYSRLYEKQGRLDEAENCLKDAIKNFGEDDIELYARLAEIYLLQDKIEEGLSFLEDALEKFPGNMWILYYLEDFKTEQHRKEKELSEGKTTEAIAWNINFEESLSIAQKDKKPLLVFAAKYGHRVPFVNQWIINNLRADSSLLSELSKYILVRTDYSTISNRMEQYSMENPNSDLFVIADDGVIIGDFDVYPISEFSNGLRNNLDKFKQYTLGKSLNTEDYTEVNNFRDALIMAEAKDYVIMVIAGSNGNEFSRKLINESVTDPVFQAEFHNLVYLYLDQQQGRDFMDKWSIKIYPSILFFSKDGNLIHKTYGYKPPDLLAGITRDIKATHFKKEPYDPPLNWLYNFDEARTIAMVENKNIFCAWSNWLDRYSLIDDRVKSVLNEKYICLDVRKMEWGLITRDLGFYLYRSSLAILDPSGKRLLQSTYFSNNAELVDWLDIEDKMKIVAILGADGYDNYNNDILLAEELYDWGLYGSAINVYNKAIEIYPENYETYIDVGDIYLEWLKPREAIGCYKKAIEYGSRIDEGLASSMVNAYLQLEEKDELIEWFDQAVKRYHNDPSSLTNLYLGLVECYEILQEKDKALEYADLAVKLDPGDYRSQFKLGRMLYHNGRPGKAIEHFKKVIGIRGNHPISLVYLGLCAEAEGKPVQRDEYFTLAKKTDPFVGRDLDKRAYWMRCNFYKYPGYIELIEQGYLYALKVDSTDDYSANNLAYLYAEEGIHLEEALNLVDLSLNEAPDVYTSLDTKAWILYKMGRLEEANNVFQEVIRLTPEGEYDQIFSYHLGKIQLALGDSVEAIKNLKKAYHVIEPDAEGMRIQEDVGRILEGLSAK